MQKQAAAARFFDEPHPNPDKVLLHSGYVEAAKKLRDLASNGTEMDATAKCLHVNSSVQTYFEDSPSTIGVIIDECGTPYCKACGKQGWEHLSTRDHQKKLDEMYLGNMLAGPAVGGRRISRGGKQNIGITAETALTQQSVMEFWGEAFPLLG